MAAPAGAAAGRILRSGKRREDEESVGEEDASLKRDARRRKKRKDEEDVAEPKRESKADEAKESTPVPAAAAAARAASDDSISPIDLYESLFVLRNNISNFIGKLKPAAEPPTSHQLQWGTLMSRYPQVRCPGARHSPARAILLTSDVCIGQQCASYRHGVCHWQEP